MRKCAASARIISTSFRVGKRRKTNFSPFNVQDEKFPFEFVDLCVQKNTAFSGKNKPSDQSVTLSLKISIIYYVINEVVCRQNCLLCGGNVKIQASVQRPPTKPSYPGQGNSAVQGYVMGQGGGVSFGARFWTLRLKEVFFSLTRRENETFWRRLQPHVVQKIFSEYFSTKTVKIKKLNFF